MRDILSKKLFKRKFLPEQVLLAEFFYLFLGVLVLFFFKINFSIFEDIWYLILLKSATVLLANWLFLSLLAEYEISFVSPLMNLSPVFLLFFTYSLLGEKIGPYGILGIIVIVICSFCLEYLSRTQIHFSGAFIKDIGLFRKGFKKFFKRLNFKMFLKICLMLTIFSLCSVSDKLILNKGATVLENLFFSAVFVLVILFIQFALKKRLIYNFQVLFSSKTLFFTSFFVNLSSFFIVSAFSLPGALISFAIPIRRLSTLFSALLGGFLFDEKNLFLKGVVVLGMIIGVFLMGI